MRYAFYFCILVFMAICYYFGLTIAKSISRANVSIRDMNDSLGSLHKDAQNGEQQQRRAENTIDRP